MQRPPLGWWLAWGLVVAVGSFIPYLHWHYQVAELIEPLRGPLGLMPTPWLFFRKNGEMATCALGFAVFAGVWAWCKPAQARAVILLAALVVLLATFVTAGLATRSMIDFIKGEVRRTAPAQREAGAGKP